MAAQAGRRRKVCGGAGAAPQDVELLKAPEPADGGPGPVEHHMVGQAALGGQDRKIVGR